jgi:uncharacterized protein (DUF305 family)
VALALPLVLGGCTSEDPELVPTPTSTSTAPVVQLGAPGEPNRRLTPEEIASIRASRTEASESDIAFARDMIPHHEQALLMARLVETNGAGRDVRLLAERMKVSQTDEVALLRDWLAALGPLPPDDHGRHGGDQHALMPGMLTKEQLAALTAARGEAFDRLFLTSMIRHHEGATAMVADLFSRPDGGEEAWLAQFARDIDADQRVEIARMQSMLARS